MSDTFSLTEFADGYKTELARCERVTRCYGNRRRAFHAIWEKAKATLIGRGWTEADAKRTLRDIEELRELERAADERDDAGEE